jgi:citrate synthase
MTQLSMGVAALNSESEFAAAYERGIKKTEYWKPAFEDSINLIAKLPALAARIYRNVYHPGRPIVNVKEDLDLVGTCQSLCHSRNWLLKCVFVRIQETTPACSDLKRTSL